METEVSGSGGLLALDGDHWRRDCDSLNYGCYRSFVSLSKNDSPQMRALGMVLEAVESALDFASEF